MHGYVKLLIYLDYKSLTTFEGNKERETLVFIPLEKVSKYHLNIILQKFNYYYNYVL